MKKYQIYQPKTISTKWSPDFAYAIGLLATDGCVYSDGYHMAFGSKDLEQVKNFKKCLGLNHIIGKNIAGHRKSFSYRVQFGNKVFWNFLVKIGITPAKSKTMHQICTPDKYFFDYLRGSFDGDGSFYAYLDKRWKNSFLFYVSFASASKNHVLWLQAKIYKLAGLKGHITTSKNTSVFQLKYAKKESLLLLKKMY